MSYSLIAIIYNPNSTGSSQTVAESFAERIREKMVDQPIGLFATDHAGHAEELAFTIASDEATPLIMSSSGDGGYHEVVNGALRAQALGNTPVTAVLPAGNANDHHRNLRDEADSETLDNIINGETLLIDVLKLHGVEDGVRIERYSHSYIGFGVTPSVAKALNKTKLSFINEIPTVLKALFAFTSTKLKISGVVKSYDSIIFSNVTTMSKFLKISRPSALDDGKFEVTIFTKRNRLALIGLLIKASISGVKEDYQTDFFELGIVRKTSLQADGEIMSLDADSVATITIEPRILRCVA